MISLSEIIRAELFSKVIAVPSEQVSLLMKVHQGPIREKA